MSGADWHVPFIGVRTNSGEEAHLGPRRPMAPVARRGAKGKKWTRDPQPGDLVLARIKGYPFYLAKVIGPDDWNQVPAPHKFFVFFFATKEIGFVALQDLIPFTEEVKNDLVNQAREKRFPKRHAKYLEEALVEICKAYDDLPNSSETAKSSEAGNGLLPDQNLWQRKPEGSADMRSAKRAKLIDRATETVKTPAQDEPKLPADNKMDISVKNENGLCANASTQKHMAVENRLSATYSGEPNEKLDHSKDDRSSFVDKGDIAESSADSVNSPKHLIAAAQARRNLLPSGQGNCDDSSADNAALASTPYGLPGLSTSPGFHIRCASKISISEGDIMQSQDSIIEPNQPVDLEKLAETDREHEKSLKPKQSSGLLSGGTDTTIAGDALKGIIETLSRTKDSIGRATLHAIEYSKDGIADELLIRDIASELNLHRRVDLLFLLDSITQCSHSQKGKLANMNLSLGLSLDNLMVENCELHSSLMVSTKKNAELAAVVELLDTKNQELMEKIKVLEHGGVKELDDLKDAVLALCSLGDCMH